MRVRIVSCFALFSAVLLSGCPGSIDDPLLFRQSHGGGSGWDGTCPPDFDVVEEIFKPSCGTLGCHTGEQFAAAGLDLTAPGVGERILSHTSDQCGGLPLVDPDDIEGSFFNQKLDPEPPCGSQMPSGMGALSADERACLNEYLERLVGGGAPLDAGLDGGVGG